MAGGPVAFQPEPMSPFIDAYLIGDGERFFAETVATWVRLRDLGYDRRQRLVAPLQARWGVRFLLSTEQKSTSAPVFEVVVEPLEAGRFPPRSPGPMSLTSTSTHFRPRRPSPTPRSYFDRASIEIARGCTEGCRFCQAGMIYRPVRERSPEKILETVQSIGEVRVVSMKSPSPACPPQTTRRCSLW